MVGLTMDLGQVVHNFNLYREVQNNVTYRNLLEESLQQLSLKKPVYLVSTRLAGHISTYLMTNHYEAPKAIIVLAQSIASAPAKHRGLISIPFWLSNIFR